MHINIHEIKNEKIGIKEISKYFDFTEEEALVIIDDKIIKYNYNISILTYFYNKKYLDYKS